MVKSCFWSSWTRNITADEKCHNSNSYIVLACCCIFNYRIHYGSVFCYPLLALSPLRNAILKRKDQYLPTGLVFSAAAGLWLRNVIISAFKHSPTSSSVPREISSSVTVCWSLVNARWIPAYRMVQSTVYITIWYVLLLDCDGFYVPFAISFHVNLCTAYFLIGIPTCCILFFIDVSKVLPGLKHILNGTS